MVLLSLACEKAQEGKIKIHRMITSFKNMMDSMDFCFTTNDQLLLNEVWWWLDLTLARITFWSKTFGVWHYRRSNTSAQQDWNHYILDLAPYGSRLFGLWLFGSWQFGLRQFGPVMLWTMTFWTGASRPKINWTRRHFGSRLFGLGDILTNWDQCSELQFKVKIL